MHLLGGAEWPAPLDTLMPRPSDGLPLISCPKQLVGCPHSPFPVMNNKAKAVNGAAAAAAAAATKITLVFPREREKRV